MYCKKNEDFFKSSRLIFINNKPSQSLSGLRVVAENNENYSQLDRKISELVAEIAMGSELAITNAPDYYLFLKSDNISQKGEYEPTDLLKEIIRNVAESTKKTIIRSGENPDDILQRPYIKAVVQEFLELAIKFAYQAHQLAQVIIANDKKNDELKKLTESAGYDSKMKGFINANVIAGKKLLSEKLDELIDQFPIALCFMDLDHFAPVNVIGGNVLGDRCLSHVAKLVHEVSWSDRHDHIFARLGGEEIGVYFADTNLSQAIVAAERIREKCEENPALVLQEYVLEKGSDIPTMVTKLIDPVHFQQMLSSENSNLIKAERFEHGRIKYSLEDKKDPKIKFVLYKVPITLSIGLSDYPQPSAQYHSKVQSTANENMDLAKNKYGQFGEGGRNRIAADGKVLTAQLYEVYREVAVSGSQSSRTLIAATVANLNSVLGE